MLRFLSPEKIHRRHPDALSADNPRTRPLAVAFRILTVTVAWVLLLATSAAAFENREAREDDVALQVDGFYSSSARIDSASGGMPFTRVYGYSFFPLLKIAGRDLVGSAEFSLLPRRFRSQGATLNGGLLQSYGLGFGYETIHGETQQGFVYGMLGLNGDMRDIGPKSLYGDLVYTHQFNLSKRLMLGGGIDLHCYFDGYFPYPVILLDWLLAEHTKIKIDFDTGEVKQFLTDRLSVSAGAQYDLVHYAFGRNEGYSLETTGAMLRWEYRIGENLYARLSLKKSFWGDEKVWTGAVEKVATDTHGASVRMQVAYGI